MLHHYFSSYLLSTWRSVSRTVLATICRLKMFSLAANFSSLAIGWSPSSPCIWALNFVLGGTFYHRIISHLCVCFTPQSATSIRFILWITLLQIFCYSSINHNAYHLLLFSKLIEPDKSKCLPWLPPHSLLSSLSQPNSVYGPQDFITFTSI